MAERTEKVIASLEPLIQGPARTFVDTAKVRGIPVMLTDGRRTMKEQAEIYAQGRTKPGQIVTKAQPGESAHNFGLAIDFALMDPTEKPTWPPVTDPRWREAASWAKALGFQWGGDWTSFKDYPHLEWPTWKQARADWQAGKIRVA